MFLEAWEIALYSDTKERYDLKFVRNTIDSEEFAFFRDYMSAEAYNCFLSKKTEYGEPGKEVLEYSKGTVYNPGTYIHYRTNVYKNIDVPDPAKTPDNDPTAWELQNRFTDAFLETVWVNHLRSILAFKVQIASIPSATYQTGSKGVSALEDDNTGFRGATKSEISFLIDSLSQRVFNKVDLMRDYIERNKDDIPCLEWKNICGCTGNGPLRNPVKNSRKFYVRGKGFA